MLDLPEAAECKYDDKYCAEDQKHFYRTNDFPAQYIPNDQRYIAPPYLPTRRRAVRGPGIDFVDTITCTGKCYNSQEGTCECTDGEYTSMFSIDTKSQVVLLDPINALFKMIQKGVSLLCATVPSQGCDWYDEYENTIGGYILSTHVNNTGLESCVTAGGGDASQKSCKPGKETDLIPWPMPKLTITQTIRDMMVIPGKDGARPCEPKEVTAKAKMKERAAEHMKWRKQAFKIKKLSDEGKEISEGRKKKFMAMNERVVKSDEVQNGQRKRGRRLLAEDMIEPRLGERFGGSVKKAREGSQKLDKERAGKVKKAQEGSQKRDKERAEKAKKAVSQVQAVGASMASGPSAMINKGIQKLIKDKIRPPIEQKIKQYAPQLWIPVIKKIFDIVAKHNLMEDQSRNDMVGKLKVVVMEKLPNALKDAILPMIALKIDFWAPQLSPVWAAITRRAEQTDIVKDHSKLIKYISTITKSDCGKVKDMEYRDGPEKKTCLGEKFKNAIELGIPSFIIHGVLKKALAFIASPHCRHCHHCRLHTTPLPHLTTFAFTSGET